ncbi:hypothetical protein B0T44_06480 [Nocardia donostiensis]|uniref:Uncharacterized protein n=1 Tax=Nocardia donostiensis TaxID=1538463 RepID=A0A1V2TI84_9NOCA|nr:hypothetical protein B0T46_07525 [Nocardia donostiensis]OQS21761.1 hypothetical protein B0T44_06480 [Nocardia donostiensis]
MRTAGIVPTVDRRGSLPVHITLQPHPGLITGEGERAVQVAAANGPGVSGVGRLTEVENGCWEGVC